MFSAAVIRISCCASDVVLVTMEIPESKLGESSPRSQECCPSFTGHLRLQLQMPPLFLVRLDSPHLSLLLADAQNRSWLQTHFH